MKFGVKENKIEKVIVDGKEKLKLMCPLCKKDFLLSPITYRKRKKENNFLCTDCHKEEYMKTDEAKEKARQAVEKAKQTSLKRYGTLNPAQSKEIQDRIKRTNLKKYGTEYAIASKAVQDKIKDTNLERYGVESTLSLKEVKEKSKQTALNKYGVDNAAKADAVKEKMKQTNLERYGTENPMGSEEWQRHYHENCLEKYGTEWHIASKEVQAKAKETMIERFNVDNCMKNEEVKQRSKESFKKTAKIKRNDPERIKRISKFLCEFKQLQVLNTSLNDNNETLFHIKCLNCGKEFNWTWIDSERIYCEDCFKSKNSSYIEKQLLNYIKSVYKGKIIENDRAVLKGKELDIYLPDINLAFEFDGCYWHNNVNNFYKYEECQKQNIRLIHVMENTWLNEDFKIKSSIDAMLNVHKNKIGARQCEIKEISNDEYKIFCEENHLQGYTTAKIRLGLFYKNDLVQIMSFSRSRFNKKYQWEMIRECSKLGYLVLGGKSKLLKYFEKNYKPQSLISYSWNDYFSGDSYLKLGFDYKYVSPVNYWYFNTKGTNFKLESRVKYQKHKLSKILKNFDENLTEWENMQMNGYGRMFDYGNKVFVKNYS